MRLAPTLAKFGLFAVISLFCGVVVVNTINRPENGDTHTYHAVFTDASGVLTGSEVRIAGVRVCKVTDVVLHDGRARVSFSVLADQEVPRDAVVSVRYADLLGNRYLAVEPGGGGAALPPGATIPAERTRPALDLTALLNGFKPLFEVIDPNEVNTLANQLIAVFQGNSATVGDLLHRIVALTAALTERDQVIADTLANLNEVLDTVNGHQAELQALVAGLGELAATAADQQQVIAQSVDNGAALAGSLSDLLTELGPGLSEDITNVGDVSAALAANQQHLEQTVADFPNFVRALNRAGQYGSWMNVYICNLSIHVAGDPIDLNGGPHSEVCR